MKCKVFFKTKGVWYMKECKSYSSAEDYFEEKLKCDQNEIIQLFKGTHKVRSYHA